jgi:L-threonylcarbamoyladenylate synthase
MALTLPPPVDELQRAVATLRAGGLVAFATETVYGLGADASNAAAVGRLFELKGRPSTHPVIVHLHDAAQMREWVSQVPPVAQRLAGAFWPGPLTLVLPRAPGVSDVITGGQDTVALRVPAHPLARELLAAFGAGIVAPSANRYGHISPTSAAHVRAEFGDAVQVLDGGDCEVGLESTIVSCLQGRVQLLRPGGISLSQLRSVAGEVDAAGDKDAPRVPGSTLQHYAPRTALRLVEDQALVPAVALLLAQGARVGVLARSAAPVEVQTALWLQAPATAVAFGHDLYANLRQLDASGCTQLLAVAAPAGDAWDAVRDRLSRAANTDC